MELHRLLHATLLSLLLYVCGAAACFPPDRRALLQLAAFSLRQNSPNTAFEDWYGDECCFWPGVVCHSANHSAAARISKIHLPYANLGGAIPQAICSLSALSTLDLSLNSYLTGSIPPCFAHNLTNLRELDLSYSFDIDPDNTRLQPVAQGEQISELLCGLKYLKVLSVRGGDVDTPGSLGNLEGEMLQPASCKSPSLNLTFLDVSNNKLRGPFPAWLSLFSNLQVLLLSGNNFSSSAIPPEWQNLTHLRVLQLSGPTSKPTNSFLLPQHMQISWLFRLPLEILTLSSLGLANQHIPCSELSLLNATLNYLDFSKNLLTGDRALHCLVRNNFTTLEFLDLSKNALAFNLSLAIPPSITKVLNLASCELQGELTDEFFGMLRSMSTPQFNLGAYMISMKDAIEVPSSIKTSSDDMFSNLEVQVGIYLAHNFFSGTLPLGIGVLLAGILELDLSYNNLKGRIPPSLGNISDLWSLNLENNQLEGEVPQVLGNMRDLVVLRLGNNKLTKWFPGKYAPSILDLSYNRLEGDLEQIFFVTDSSLLMVILLLGHNRLSGAIPYTLFNGTTAPYLSMIQLSNNNLTGTIPHTLFIMFPGLTLDRSSYIDSILYPRTFTLVMKNLELSYDPSKSQIFPYLDLSSNKLNGSIPESLGQLSLLKSLNLSRNQLTGNIPSSLSNLSLLKSLDLSYNRLNGSLPASLSNLKQLEVFNVSFNEELTGPIPANSPQLQQDTSYIGDLKLCGAPYLQRRCPDVGATSVVPHPEEDHKIEERESFLMQWIDEWIAIPGLCLGIVVGFSGALWVLRFISFIQNLATSSNLFM